MWMSELNMYVRSSHQINPATCLTLINWSRNNSIHSLVNLGRTHGSSMNWNLKTNLCRLERRFMTWIPEIESKRSQIYCVISGGGKIWKSLFRFIDFPMESNFRAEQLLRSNPRRVNYSSKCFTIVALAFIGFNFEFYFLAIIWWFLLRRQFLHEAREAINIWTIFNLGTKLAFPRNRRQLLMPNSLEQISIVSNQRWILTTR